MNLTCASSLLLLNSSPFNEEKKTTQNKENYIFFL